MKYTSQRRHEEKERRREDIVNAAERVFAKHGFAQSTMDQVARQARVSRALVYVYFKDKDELQFEICSRALNLLRERFEAALLAHATGAEQITAIGLAYMGFAREMPDYFAALSRFEAHQPQVPGSADHGIVQKVMQAGNAVHAVTVQALKNGVADGSIRNDLPDLMLIAMTLWGFSHGTIQLALTKSHFIHERGYSPDEFTQQALAFGMQSLAPAMSAGGLTRSPSPPLKARA